MIRRRRAVALALTCIAATSCATTYDASEDTVATTSTSTTVPTGTPAALLQRMLDEAGKLGTVMHEQGSQATSALEQVEALWDAVDDEVQRTHPHLFEDFEANVGRCRSAVERNRPADADKAYRNLASLVASYGAR